MRGPDDDYRNLALSGQDDGRRAAAAGDGTGRSGLAERGWPGACLRIGAVRIGVQDLRARCIMTSFDPDTQQQDKSVTHGIHERFEGKLALNCFLIEGGAIAVGDEVVLLRGRGCESRKGTS